ncbi:MAG: PAS domain-containing protein [Alphaproteobacteria bacterium]|nr:MAG: PAS domain-containing protein [Alphaproteobacteria bacterium]
MSNGDYIPSGGQTGQPAPRTGGTLDTLADATSDLNLLFGFQDICAGMNSRYLREMLDLYAGLYAARDGLPVPAQFDPTALPRHLPNLFMVQLEGMPGGGFTYRYHMFGTGLALLFGQNLKGLCLEDFPDQNRVARSRRIFDAATSACGPVRTAGQFVTRNGMPIWGEGLLLPFGEMGTVTHILADLDYDTHA